MALPANALLTLAEAKEHLRVKASDTQNDSWIETLIGEVSGWLEEIARRRFRFQPEVGATLATAAAWVSGAIVFTAPAYGSRLRVVGSAGQNGSIAVVGVVAGAAFSETFAIADGAGDSAKFYDSVTSATLTVTGGVGTFNLVEVRPYTEFQTCAPTLYSSLMAPIDAGSKMIHTIERPLFQLVELNEDASLQFTASTRKVANVDYASTPRSGRIVKLRGLGAGGIFGPDFPEDWAFRFGQRYGGAFISGPRAVRLLYGAGYQSVNLVPTYLKLLVAEPLIAVYRGRERKDTDQQSKSDSAGSYSKADVYASLKQKMTDLNELTYDTGTGEREN